MGRKGPASALVALVALLVTPACAGDDAGTAANLRVHRARAATTTTGAPTTTTEPSTSPPTVATTQPVASTLAPVTSPPTAAASPVEGFVGVEGAGQVIAVIAEGYGQTTATFTAYERVGDAWQQVFGPWDAHIGFNGFAAPGAKREGDGRTPSGRYGFDFFFGVEPDPGVSFPYRVVTSSAIVWDDDPASPRYNEWVDTTTQGAGADPEPMYNPAAYSYGAVIAYNNAKTAGSGSAIFLHVSTGGATAGCVSLPASELLQVVRWLDPARQPRIVMGTRADVTG